jgi:RNA polymerase-binding transcription factor DksA
MFASTHDAEQGAYLVPVSERVVYFLVEDHRIPPHSSRNPRLVRFRPVTDDERARVFLRMPVAREGSRPARISGSWVSVKRRGQGRLGWWELDRKSPKNVPGRGERHTQPDCRCAEAGALTRSAAGWQQACSFWPHLEVAMESTTALRHRLEARLGEIAKRVGRIESDLRIEHDRDSEERAIELENDQVLEGLDEMGRAEVLEIRATLARLSAGTYGFCTECGQPIGEPRLKAMPTASRCLYCAG